jgi:ArsR family transcriptional regulator, arsenate/arsenite/antimonite-responsive transcriptional repressor
MHSIVKAVKALSDETRLRIINLLLVRECCVCEIMQTMNISQTRASRNLYILYDAGFLKLRREGLWSLYSLDNNMPGQLLKLVEAVEEALSGNDTAQKDKLHLKKACRTGTACCSKNNLHTSKKSKTGSEV